MAHISPSCNISLLEWSYRLCCTMAAAKMTTHAAEQSSVALHASLAATDDAINHNVGGNVDASASMPITRQLLANLLRSNSRSMHGQPNHADAETTIDATEQLTAATDPILTATEHATSRNAAEQSVEAEEVIWQVKLKSRQDLPQEASAMVEAAHKEGRTDSGIYQQRRSRTLWEDYIIDFTTMMQTNRVSGTRRAARRQILTTYWRPTEVTTELSGVWREAIEDTRQHQHNKGNKMRRIQHGDDDSRQ